MALRPISIARLERRLRAARSRKSGGFTLLELMVVVILIGILALTAIPTMGQARIDRHVYEDAARIADLVRDARTHAIGRGAAVMVSFTPDTIASYEAVSANPGGAGSPRVPVGSCDGATKWSTATSMNLVRSIALTDAGGHSYEQDNGISARIFTSTPAAQTTQSAASICFTPMGRAFISLGTGTVFTNAMTQALTVEVARKDGSNVIGLRRQVIIPPSGNTRITAQ
jgi:prepilin-type N-terminal cleavage/methylation domain-containing protein